MEKLLGQIVNCYERYKVSFYKDELYLDSDETEKFREVIEAIMTYSKEELTSFGVDIEELHALLLDDIIFPDCSVSKKPELK